MTSINIRPLWLIALVTSLFSLGCPDSCSSPEPDQEDAPGLDVLHFGTYHVCLLDTAKKVWCTGKNSAGQLGDGTTADSAELVEVVGLEEITGLAVGHFDTTCAWNEAGELYCWGNNQHGVLADDELEFSSEPVRIADLPPVIDVTIGGFHACALTEDANLYCWGLHSSGQVGVGSDYEDLIITTPAEIAVPGDVRKVRAGGEHTCAIAENNQISCWGSNEKGQLGLALNPEDTPVLSIPTAVVFLPEEAVDIDVAFHHACALIGERRRLYCWGSNAYGQFGLDDLDLRDAPTEISDIAYVDQLALGSAQVCVRIEDEVLCAGEVLRPVEVARETGEGYFFRPSEALKYATELWSGVLAICGRVDEHSVACRGVEHQGISGDIF